MALYHNTGVSIESWVEMRENVTARCEVDRLNDQATLFFGARDDYVLCLGRDTLRQVADLAEKAHAELDAADLIEDEEVGGV